MHKIPIDKVNFLWYNTSVKKEPKELAPSSESII